MIFVSVGFENLKKAAGPAFACGRRSYPCSLTGSKPISMMAPAAVTLLILATIVAFCAALSQPSSVYDPWCRDHCSSLRACNDLFGSDHIDLRVKTVGFSQLDGPGNSLTGDLYHGDSVSKQTFQTQFVLDIAVALDVSPVSYTHLRAHET